MSEVYSGGRSLNAIWDNPSLTTYQKVILAVFSSELDYRGDFSEWRYCRIELFEQRTGLSRRTVQRTLADLASNGYIDIAFSCGKDGKTMASSYRLLPRLFEEFLAILEKKEQEKRKPKIRYQNKNNKLSTDVKTAASVPQTPTVKTAASVPQTPTVKTAASVPQTRGGCPTVTPSSFNIIPEENPRMKASVCTVNQPCMILGSLAASAKATD